MTKRLCRLATLSFFMLKKVVGWRPPTHYTPTPTTPMGIRANLPNII